jgi:hypothetical protein
MKYPKNFASLPLLLLTLVACGDEPDSKRGSQQYDSVYAIMYEVFDDLGSTSYLSLLPSVDIDKVESGDSREYGGGRAFLQAYNGWVFVGDASSPIVTRYSVSETGEMTDEQEISFADYGLTAGSLDTWNATFISPTKAYLFDFEQAVNIIWNPTTMKIIGDIPASPEFKREGYSFEGSPGMVRGNRLFRTFDWVNYDTGTYDDEQLLAIYDVEKDELLELVPEKRCAAFGNLVHKDESDNIYFSSWIWPVGESIVHDEHESCVLRIPADSERFDPDWKLSYPEITGGMQGAMFSYVGDGKALISVFHDEMTSFDDSTDSWAYIGEPFWEIWSIDIEQRTGAPVSGIPLNTGAFTPAVFDGHQFVMVPGADWAETQLYEMNDDGSATGSITVPGWTYQFVKVR